MIDLLIGGVGVSIGVAIVLFVKYILKIRHSHCNYNQGDIKISIDNVDSKKEEI